MMTPQPRDAVTESGPNDGPNRRVVAIDGPTASGKSTVARSLAERIDALFFDTGVLYRAVTLAALRAGIAMTDEAALAALADTLHIEVSPASVGDGRLYDVRVDGEDATWAIRSREVDAAVSPVSAHPAVRNALLPTQRRIAASGPVVMVGRDIGSVIVPNAGVKIYLVASVEERARRRHRELVERGDAISYAQVLTDLQRRDTADQARQTAPLTRTPDATEIQTNGLTVEQVVDRIERIVLAVWSS